MKAHFDRLSDALFSELKSGEDAIFSLDAEDSLFVRLNAGKIRQTTAVVQKMASLDFQSHGRSSGRGFTLTGDFELDMARTRAHLTAARTEAALLPADPHQVAVVNNGSSTQNFDGAFPEVRALIRELTDSAEGSDLAGLFSGGPLITANRNSKGQSHWFSTHNFFVDYSLYAGPKAAKSVYAGANWNSEAWRSSLQSTKNQLALLNRPARDVKPGKYRTYFAPSASAELTGMMGWGALSYSALKQGRSPFQRLHSGERQLSALFSMRENFAMGLRPAFNGLGEVSATQIPLIEKGVLKNLLISSRSSREYGVPGNAASEGESPRSLEILGGALRADAILKELGTGLYLSNLHYLNWSDPTSARITGMTRYACFWVENGEIVAPINNLRFDESLYDCLGQNLVAVTDFQEINPATSTYHRRALGGEKTPGLLVDGFTFTL